MNCQRCQSERIVEISAKCSDLCYVEIEERESNGYVPRDMGIGGGDYVELTYCADCGQIQGEFPLPETELETQDTEDDGL